MIPQLILEISIYLVVDYCMFSRTVGSLLGVLYRTLTDGV
jgi:hypothetical protein